MTQSKGLVYLKISLVPTMDLRLFLLSFGNRDVLSRPGAVSVGVLSPSKKAEGPNGAVRKLKEEAAGRGSKNFTALAVGG